MEFSLLSPDRQERHCSWHHRAYLVMFLAVAIFTYALGAAKADYRGGAVVTRPLTEKERQRYLAIAPVPPAFEEIVTPEAPKMPAAPLPFTGQSVDKYGFPVSDVLMSELSSPSLDAKAISNAAGFFDFSNRLPSNPLFMAHRKGMLPSYFSAPADNGGHISVLMYAQHPLEPISGALLLQADTIEYDNRNRTLLAKGAVRLWRHDGGGELRAPLLSFTGIGNIASASGGVVFADSEDTVRGDSFSINTDDFTGSITNASIFFSKGNYYISGASIAKTGEASYRANDSVVTTCDGSCPDWRIRAKQAGVTIDGYGYARGAVLYGGDVPLLYLPYLVFPAKKTRQSGLLAPYLAFSNDRLGFDWELPLYLALSENTDATLYHRQMSKRGNKEGGEFRYILSEEHYGTIYGDFLDDRGVPRETGISEGKRWSFYLNHYSRLGDDAHLRADIAKVSDRWYFKDFSSYNYYLANRDRGDAGEKFRKVAFVGNEALATLDSTLRISKSTAGYGATALFKYTDNLTSDSNEATIQKYPEVMLNIIKQPLFGSPVLWEMANRGGYYHSAVDTNRGYAGDLAPYLSLPLQYEYFRITPHLGWQTTFWDREKAAANGNSQGVRNIAKTGFSVATELSQIYDFAWLGMEKLKHTIKPEITYEYTALSQASAPLPDYIAGQEPLDVVTYALINDVIARERDKEGNPYYRQILYAKIYQSYNFRETADKFDILGNPLHPFSDMGIEMDFNPHSYFSLRLRNQFSTNRGKMTEENYETLISDSRGDAINIAYRYNEELQLREAEFGLDAPVDDNLSLSFKYRRDIFNKRNIETAYALTYKKQCWDASLSYSVKTIVDIAGRETPDRVLTFMINLYGLGRFGF